MNIFKTAPMSGKASCALMVLGMLALPKANAQQWSLMGPVTGISGGKASFQNLVKDGSGNFYASFYDLAVSKGSVMKYDGTAWSYLGGSAGITSSIATYNSLGVAANGDVYYCNQAAYPASGVNVRKFSNNAWTSLPDAESNTSNFQAMVIDTANKPIIAYSSSGAKVKRYNGTSWDVLGTGLPTGTPYYLDAVIGSNDSVYVSWVGTGGMVVYKISANASATDTWTELGTTGFSATSSEQYRSAMAIDANNNVYVAFTSTSANGNKINVKKYSGGLWSDVGSSNFSAYRVHYVSIAISPAGMPYVAFSNFENNPNSQNYVMRYNNAQWETVGTAISDGAATYNALNFDNAGNPVLIYSDAGITAGNMVKKFTNTTTCTNTLPGTTVGDVGCVTFNYKGQNVTYTTVRAADGNVWLQQNLGASGIAVSKTDTAAYGDCFQWGRWDDGHQNRNSATGAVPTPNNPTGLGAGVNTFLIGAGTAAWWNGGALTDTWTANAAANVTTTTGADPCKAIGPNWHLPSQTEWADVVADELITNPDLAFSSNLKLTVGGSRSSSSGSYDFVGVRGYYWSSTTSSTGAKYYYFSAAVNNTGAGNLRGGGASVRCLNTTGNVTIVDSIKVTTQNNVAATINTNGGTLQMQATVYPTVNNQNVTWSIVNGTGTATISATGLVTANTNGTVWTKAISVADPTKIDSLQVTISNQVVAITSIDVTTQNNVAASITTNAGTLQMVSTILPANANQDVTWSIINGTGTATISVAGLVTANTNGTVWAKAISVADPTKVDSLQITISNQVVAITSIDVTTQNNVAANITTNAGTLQMVSTILPANANQDVTWSIVTGTGTATISATGLVTANTNGTVWAKAISIADPTKVDSLQITISNQVVAITSIDVTTQNNVAASITANGGTLQMVATILPSNANQDVAWSIVNGTGTATISSTGLVAASANGTVWAKAVALADVSKSDSLLITLSGQGTVTAIRDLKDAYGLEAYPNPVQETLSIQSATQHPALNIELMDVYGRTILHAAVKANALLQAYKIDMSRLANGIYILTIKDDKGSFVKKIIKQ